MCVLIISNGFLQGVAIGPQAGLPTGKTLCNGHEIPHYLLLWTKCFAVHHEQVTLMGVVEYKSLAKRLAGWLNQAFEPDLKPDNTQQFGVAFVLLITA